MEDYELGYKHGKEMVADGLYKEIERLRRNKNTWKAKAERLIGYNNKKDKEIERLKLELKEIEEEQNNLGIERDLLT